MTLPILLILAVMAVGVVSSVFALRWSFRYDPRRGRTRSPSVTVSEIPRRDEREHATLSAHRR